MYDDLLTTHFHYCELVESDEQFVKHRTVGGLDLTQYLEAIESTHASAMQYYAQFLSNDVSNAIEKAHFFNSKLDSDTYSAHLMQQADEHLTLCKELTVSCENAFDFSTGELKSLEKIMFQLSSSLYECKQKIGREKSVHFDRTLQSSSSSDHLPISESEPQPRVHDSNVVQVEGVAPQSESTRTSLDLQGSVSHSSSNNLPNRGNLQDNICTNISEMSIVNAYSTGQPPSTIPFPESLLASASSDTGRAIGKSKFEKTPLPTFSGDRKSWPEFRSVWRVHAHNEYANDLERAWALKTCLRGRALDCVKAVLITQPDAYARMWKRLEGLYCDVSLSVQSVHEDMRKLKQVAEGDLLGLVDFVDQVEMCYSQLGEVGQIDCISMPQIDSLCDLLPVNTRKDWMRIYRSADVKQQMHPYNLFMTFLEGERDISIRLAERQRKKDKLPKSYSGSTFSSVS